MSVTFKYQLHPVWAFASCSQGAPDPASKHIASAMAGRVRVVVFSLLFETGM
jgi:hypothetical protein